MIDNLLNGFAVNKSGTLEPNFPNKYVSNWLRLLSTTGFRAIAPNGRIPLVVCKQANCNCHLPHAAPPIQMHPAHLRAAKSPSSSSSGVKVSEDDAVKSKGM